MRIIASILIFCFSAIPQLANSHEFDATFDSSTNILSIPYLEVPTLGTYSISLSLSDLENLRFDLVDATEVVSQSSYSGSYSLET